MKLILEFDMDCNDREYLMAIEGWKGFGLLDDISTYIRRKYKYDEPQSDSHFKEYEEIRDHIFEMIRNSDISPTCFT